MSLLVLVDAPGGELDEVSQQTLTFARRLAGGDAVHAVAIGADAASAAGALAAHGVAAFHVAQHDALSAFAPDAHAAALVQLAGKLSPAAIVGSGTERGNDVLARTAARLDAAFAAGCVAATAGSPLAVTRVRWGGSLLEEALVHGATPVLSVAPHAVAIEEAAGGEPSVEAFAPALTDADLAVRVSDHVDAGGGGISLADAKVVVSGGRGAGSAEGFAPIEELAGLLGGAVGCSRAVTMAGWRPHTDQVGQTGTKIAPDIYIPCGVSGATQHMAGCKGAKRILAINADREASIFANADYAVIGDLHQVLPAISAEIRRVRGG
jgi:electron transfer flavoprotein alpha subunit